GGAITRMEKLNYFVENPVLALRIEILKNAPVTVENRRRVLLLVGTSETEGEIRLMAGVKISRNQSGVIFFKPKNPVFTLVGDRVILRLPSPMITLGGGVVLDHLKTVPSQKDLMGRDYLSNRDAGYVKQLILSELQKEIVIKENQLLDYSILSKAEISAAVNELILESRCDRFDEFVFESDSFFKTAGEIVHIVNRLFSARKNIGGLTISGISQSSSLSENIVRVIADYLVEAEKLQTENDFYGPMAKSESLAPAMQAAYNQITFELNKSPMMPPGISDFAARGRNYKDAIRLMLKSGEIHKCGGDFVFLSSTWNEIVTFVKNTLKLEKSLSVGKLRDKFNITRKYAIPILEETDRIKLTRRQGDIRVKGDKFNA
ncbi:MAG: SelB C-terminal domain-containing protein, partial [Candidatus Zixiibacteriota bacterium]